MARAINEANTAFELRFRTTVGAFRGGRVVMRWLTFWASVNEHVRVSDSDGYAASQLFRVPRCPDASQRLYEGALAIVNVPQSPDVDLRLPVYDFVVLLLQIRFFDTHFSRRSALCVPEFLSDI